MRKIIENTMYCVIALLKKEKKMLKNLVIFGLIVLTGWMLYQQNFTEEVTEEIAVVEIVVPEVLTEEATFSVAETSLEEIPAGKGRVNFPKIKF